MPERRPISPVVPTPGALGGLRPLGLGEVTITGGLLAERQWASARNGIPAGRRELEASGVLDNFRRAAGAQGLVPRGPRFADSDAYKWLEAAAWESRRSGHPVGDQSRIGGLVAAAQHADGYLDTMTDDPYTDLTWSHEHYVAGHLIQAAIAQRRAGGADELLPVAVRLADHLGERFGPGRDEHLDGHPEIETALVELYRETGRRRYLDLAGWMVGSRGSGRLSFHEFESSYFCDRVPVRDQGSIEGHAVRAVYLAAGATDVAVETGDTALLDVLRSQFTAMWASRTYLTGGIGARWEQEAFGDAFELPSDRAYAETCAAIGLVQWAWRLFLATGEASYGDAIERVLYNAVLSGVSASGDRYLYVNPLELRSGALAHDGRSPADGRRAWFDCACCPPNVMRLLASAAAYLAAADESGLWLVGYASSTVDTGWGHVRIDTDHPHGAGVRVVVTGGGADDWTLRLRVPGWASGVEVEAPGCRVSVADGWALVEGAWREGDAVDLSWRIEPRLIAADSRLDATRAAVAVEVGPLVQAFEEIDNPGLEECFVLPGARPRLDGTHPDGSARVRLDGIRRPASGAEWPYREIAAAGDPGARPAGEAVGLTGVPYHAWGERAVGPMRVWLPVDQVFSG